MHAIDMVIPGAPSFMVAGPFFRTLFTLDLSVDPVLSGMGASAVVLIALTLIAPARVAGGS